MRGMPNAAGRRDEGDRADRLGQQGRAAAHGEDDLHDREGRALGGAWGELFLSSFLLFFWSLGFVLCVCAFVCVFFL